MNKYRYFDYYQMTEIFDNLYEKSKNNKRFNKLHGIIASENNIKLAFRMIKTNHGSKTSGIDKMTIKDIKETDIENYIPKIKERLENYKSKKIRRVWIPKGINDRRPLGIPTIEDRIIQQAIKQVIEPICEAKFHNHSYGFRPNRSTAHALARVNYLINQAGFYYTVDLDIKSFFDNVNHNKLIKQLFTLGIRDRKVLAIIKQMLKAKV
ncbi:reverse transcriptase domain-containing protein, partial [Clostridium perfringens]